MSESSALQIGVGDDVSYDGEIAYVYAVENGRAYLKTHTGEDLSESVLLNDLLPFTIPTSVELCRAENEYGHECGLLAGHRDEFHWCGLADESCEMADGHEEPCGREWDVA